MNSRRNTDAGFTLTEILVVLAIIGILFTIVVSSYSASAARAGAVACTNNRHVMSRAAAGDYRELNDGAPKSIGDLEPYVTNWSSAKVCPTNRNRELFLDLSDGSVVCPIHGK